MLASLVAFRRRMRQSFGLKLREEIHAGAMFTHPGALVRIKRNDRLAIVRHLIDELAGLEYVNVITVRVDKLEKPEGYDPFVKG